MRSMWPKQLHSPSLPKEPVAPGAVSSGVHQGQAIGLPRPWARARS
jgi:hypothetical protein